MRTLLAVICVTACTPAAVNAPDAGDAGDFVPDAGALGVPDAGPSAACLKRQDDLQAALDHLGMPNAQAVAVASNDCPTLVAVHGAATAQSLWRLASVTKTYVAASIVSLAGEGLLGLDDTLDHFSMPVPNAQGITVRQLLDHTSGLYDYTQSSAFNDWHNRPKPQTPEALLALATAHPPAFAPGTGWAYSNTEYIVLGMIAKQVTGKPLSDVLQERAVGPAHLTSTFFDGEVPLVGDLVRGYDAKGNDVTQYRDPSWLWAAGAMVATISDEADWGQALWGGKVLSAVETASLTAQPVGDDGQVSWGLGVMILSASLTGGQGIAVGHGGDLDGYHGLVFYFPQRQRTFAIEVDSDALDPNDVYGHVFAAALEP